jgi:hypothetical protein
MTEQVCLLDRRLSVDGIGDLIRFGGGNLVGSQSLSRLPDTAGRISHRVVREATWKTQWPGQWCWRFPTPNGSCLGQRTLLAFAIR